MAIRDKVKDLGSGDQRAAYRAFRELSTTAARATGGERAKLAAELADELIARSPPPEEKADGKGKRKARKDAKGDLVHSAKTRREVARILGSVAGDAEVGDLKEALGDMEVREAVRWALDRMQSPGATEVLVEAAQKAVGTEFRVGAVNALAKRSGTGVVQVLKALLGDPEREVKAAAAEALANHADQSADAALAAALKAAGQGASRYKSRLVRSRVRLGETLARAGQKDVAKKIFQAVGAEATDEATKRAAKIGLDGETVAAR